MDLDQHVPFSLILWYVGGKYLFVGINPIHNKDISKVLGRSYSFVPVTKSGVDYFKVVLLFVSI